ncbi:MAG: hypothetical protein J0L92_29595 [Deltaproteobacteria bacterium]|nr:hypothetical protein [Deltaproteobacteria bacterium]
MTASSRRREAPEWPYAVHVLVVALPSGMGESDSDGVVEYVHVWFTAFVIVSIAARTSLRAGGERRKHREFSIASKRPQKPGVLGGLNPLAVTP